MTPHWEHEYLYKVLPYWLHSQGQNCLFHFTILASVQRYPARQCLSTTVFPLSVNSIGSVLLPGAQSSLYVDDLTIFGSDQSIPTLCQLLQSAILLVSSWATYQSFSILFFCILVGCQSSLFLHGAPLKYCPSGKVLGVIFYSKLTRRSSIPPLTLTHSLQYILGFRPHNSSPSSRYPVPLHPQTWTLFFCRYPSSCSPQYNLPLQSSLRSRCLSLLASWEPAHWIWAAISLLMPCPSLSLHCYPRFHQLILSN